MGPSQQKAHSKIQERHMNTSEDYFELNTFFKKNDFSKFFNSSILVTGGTGIIGFSLLYLLSKIGFKNLHCLTRTKPSTHHLINEVTYHEVDLRKSKLLKNSIPDFDFIIHSAGYAQPNKFLMDPLGVFNINVDATRDLIYKCKKSFSFVSTSEIYSGNFDKLYESSSGMTNPQHKRACYIESKRSGEFLTSAISSELNIDSKIFRVSTAYGPGFSINDNRVITDFIRNAIIKKNINIKAGANQTRQVNYSFDAAQKMVLAIFKGQNNIYNISGTNKITIAEIASKIADYTNSSYSISQQDDNTGAPLIVDIVDKNFIEEFCFNINTSFENIIKNSVIWFKKINSI